MRRQSVFFGKALADRMKLLGSEHLDTLETMNKFEIFYDFQN
jgi:hypothetical protein